MMRGETHSLMERETIFSTERIWPLDTLINRVLNAGGGTVAELSVTETGKETNLYSGN